MPDKTLFNNQYETKLFESVAAIDTKKLQYHEVFESLSKIVPVIDEFFENVLVMDKDEKVKKNRRTLLYNIKNKFDKIADFSKLVL